MLLTTSILQRILPLTWQRAHALTERINSICTQPRYGIEDKNTFEEFLATVIHESGGFTIYEENLDYSSPQRLMDVWPKHFPSLEFAEQYVKQPEKLANYIYGETSIAKDLGNTKPGDGWSFRGSGPMQLTGRTTAEAYTAYNGFDHPETMMKLVRSTTDDYWAIDSACWEFCVSKKLLKYAVSDDFITITKRINGGLIGLEDREHWLKRVKLYLV